MVAAMLDALFERGLDAKAVDQSPYSHDRAVTLRVVTTVCACVSILADSLALVWFLQMKRKFRHSLIMTLILADLIKDINWVAFSIVAFVRETIPTTSAYCQASGFIAHAAIEVTDLSVLLIVIHMSLQILNPKFAADRLERFRHTILTAICLLAVVLSSVPFAGSDQGYRLAGAFCMLPARPIWYRLALDWIERYIIAIVIVALTIAIRYKVKAFQQTLARLQAHDLAGGQPGGQADIIEEPGEVDSGMGQEDSSEKEKDADHLEPEKHNIEEVIDVPDDEHNQFGPANLQKYKRQSYRIRRQTNVFENQPRVVSMAASAAPSSAIFSPYRDSFRINDLPQTPGNDQTLRSSSVFDMPARRQSVAVVCGPIRGMSVMETPRRRASLVDIQGSTLPPTTRSSMYNGSTIDGRPGDRSSVLFAPPARRASIWDEIDASLDKKFANNRLSMLSMTPSQTDVGIIRPASAACLAATNPNRASTLMLPLPEDRRASSSPADVNPKRTSRTSRVYDRARRTMSMISRAGGEGGPDDGATQDSAAVILARRHRYIQRQMRYLILYPIVYLSLWLCPFVLHCLQYSDRLARSPPYALVVLSYISICCFGFANSLIFCLREKPWTLIQNSDGTVWGSLRPGFVLRKLGLGRGVPHVEEQSWLA